MHAEPGSLRKRLNNSANDAWKLYCALEIMLPYKEVTRGEPISRQKLTASTIPWHGAVAGLIGDFYAEVRRLEVNLKAAVTGVRGVRRAGSDGNTRMAVQSIVNLCYAQAVDDQMVMGVLGYFDRWSRQAQAVFDPDRGLHRIPRAPGEEEMRCPWCTYQMLRWQPATGRMICINPECRTDSDVRPAWMAVYQLVGDELQFTWEAVDKGDV